MTQRSQDRQHTGRRGAAQRKARREGYAYREVLDITGCPAGLVDRCIARHLDAHAKPHLAAAFRHGAHDWARKHKELADAVA